MVIKCRMCGGDITFTPGDTYGTCEYCGSTSTIPKAEDEGKLNRYNRADHFRRRCEFDKALAAYEKLLETDDRDAEAHWGAVLSRYGIEYVEDPKTKKRVPTCHRVQVTSVLADADYLAAVENAPDNACRELYRQQAAEIAEIQKGILAISQNESPYDVFICYKETDDQNKRTRDSALAQEVYYGLTEKGYKVFFSRITLEDKLGREYEPYIFAALNSAKVMVVIGTRPEHFSAVWVRNEWSRYLMLMGRDRSRLLIPCYRDMDPYDLPEELSGLQSQDMSRIGFMQDLLRGIGKVLEKDEKKSEPAPRVIETRVVQETAASGTGNTEALLKRAVMALEDGEWSRVNEFCEQVLNQDAENARAYLYKLMAQYRVKTEKAITELRRPIDDDPSYQKARRFAVGEEKQRYEGYAKAIRDGIEYDRKDALYAEAKQIMDSAGTSIRYLEAAQAFEKVSGHRDASAQAKRCRELASKRREAEERARAEEARRAEIRRKDEVNEQGETELKYGTIESCERAIKTFESIIDWKDARAKAQEARTRLEELKRKAEAERRAAEETARKKRKLTIIGTAALAAVIAVAIVFVTVIQPMQRYNAAKQLIVDGRYDEATEAFLAMGDYSDATTQALAAQYAEGEALLKSGDYDGATQAFMDAGDYSDATTQALAAQYRKADVLKKAGSYDEAYAVYATLSGYKDVDTIIETDENIAAAAAAAAAAAHAAYVAQFDVGKTVTLGSYGGEPIEWLVLDAKDDTRILIAVKGQDAVCFNKNSSDGNAWETSYVRSWLNGTFYEEAFSEEEKAQLTTGVTGDRVYLLSVDEAKSYFGSDDARVCYPTETAKKNGVYTNSAGACWWWLRSPGSYGSSAADVHSVGSVDSSGYVDYGSGAVRPVVSVRLL